MKVICGVPENYCLGGLHECSDQMSGKIRYKHKMHGGHEEAFNCMAHYLVNELGFTRRGPREFKNPENGYIRILTKKTRFGHCLRKGKRGGDGGGFRYMPKNRPGGMVIG